MTIRLAPKYRHRNPLKFPLRKRLRAWGNPRWQAGLAAAVALIFLLTTWSFASRWYAERLLVEQRAEVVGELSARGSALTSVLSRRLARLQGLHAYVQTEGSSADFGQKYEQFAGDLYDSSRGIRNLAVAPGGEVQYVYPLEGNESVLGYRPLEDPRPDVVADVQRAIETQQIIISGPIELVQGGLGLIARQAVYQEGLYWGLVNVVIDIPPLISEAGIEGETNRLEYALRDDQGRIFHGSADVFDKSPIITQIILSEGYWELASAPRDGWLALIGQPLLLVRLGSLITIALLTSLVYLTVNRQARLATAVEQRTTELSAVNAQLEQRVEERTLELTMLLNISRSIASTWQIEVLLDQVLFNLLSVVDYTGGAVLTLEDGVFTIYAYQGPYPQESMLQRQYAFDNMIARRLLEEQKPVLIPDVSDTSAMAVSFRQATGLDPKKTKYIRSWMGIPLIVKEQVIGLLALHHRRPAVYSQHDADFAMAFANQVAVAIENARLYEKSQTLAILQERQRLARELHDSVSQALYGISLGTRTARTILERTATDAKAKEALGEPLDYVLSLAEGGLAEMRAMIFELRPESLASEGLVAALSKQAAALHARHHIEVTISLAEEPDAPLPIKEALYRVTQEAFHNIVRHAQASQVSITLSRDNGQLFLEVRDDGRGFDPAGNFAGHLGLRSMRERVEQLQGTLVIESAPGQGTRITATTPVS